MTAAVGTLYALVDPQDGTVRYIGQTTKPLRVRLAGHLSNPSPRVASWLADLAQGGVQPQIVPVRESVPAADLLTVEREEITARLLAGEDLLNEAIAASARQVLFEREEDRRREAVRVAWEHVANQVRALVGGPMSPGDLSPIPLDPRSMHAYSEVLRIQHEPEVERLPGDDHHISARRRVRIAQGEAGDILWGWTRGAWGRLRGMARNEFDDILEARICAATNGPWADPEDLPRYLALVPWGMVAVSPWAALAERAGMDASGKDFIEWVSDDPAVREGLHLLLVRAGARMGPLSRLDDFHRDQRPSVALVAMAAAHGRSFDLPELIRPEIVEALRCMARDRELTEPMADLLCDLDPKALDRTFGPDIAADIDSRLGLPPGTARDVLATLLADRRAGVLGKLEDVVDRAGKKMPTVTAPNYSQWRGNSVPATQSVIASLIKAGLMGAPEHHAEESFMAEVRALWTAKPEWYSK